MRVFVYGTLKKGLYNHYLLQTAKFVGDAVTEPKYTMFSTHGDHFPMVAAGGNQSIHGELYDVDSATMDRLDILEGHPKWYKRELIPTSGGPASVYLMPREKCEGLNEVQSGNWR